MSKCKEWGEAREVQNLNGKDAKEYQNSTTHRYTSRQASILGVIGEVAVAQYLGMDIDSQTWVVYRDENGKYPKGLKQDADLKWKGQKVEVRNSVWDTNDLAVKHKDVRADAINVLVHVHVGPNGPTGEVTIKGWVNAKTGKRLGRWDERGYWVAKPNPMLTFPFRGVAA